MGRTPSTACAHLLSHPLPGWSGRTGALWHLQQRIHETQSKEKLNRFLPHVSHTGDPRLSPMIPRWRSRQQHFEALAGNTSYWFWNVWPHRKKFKGDTHEVWIPRGPHTQAMLSPEGFCLSNVSSVTCLSVLFFGWHSLWSIWLIEF